MTIQRVPQVPFAQIANTALRDKRLSFKARGVLALVLSHSGEWNATRRWLETQSDCDGKAAIQSALNELTALGYRTVTYERKGSDLVTVVVWRHHPEEPISGLPENRSDRKPDGPETGRALEHNSKEHNLLEHKEITRFDEFWNAYPRKAAKPAAVKAWHGAVKKVDPSVIIDGAKRYRDDPNRDEAFTAHPSTWLNQERWNDQPLPGKARSVTGGQARMSAYEDLFNQFGGRELEQ